MEPTSVQIPALLLISSETLDKLLNLSSGASVSLSLKWGQYHTHPIRFSYEVKYVNIRKALRTVLSIL